MTEYKKAVDILVAAYKTSNGKKVDVVVDHGILKGIDSKLMILWGKYMNEPEYYKRWHPEDHVSHEIADEVINGKNVKVIHANESVGPFGASVLRALPGDPAKFDFPKVYKPFSLGIMLSPDNEEMGAIFHEFEDCSEGLKMRSTFRMPADVPKEFQDAMYNHSKEEMSNLTQILPELYEKEKAESNGK